MGRRMPRLGDAWTPSVLLLAALTAGACARPSERAVPGRAAPPSPVTSARSAEPPLPEAAAPGDPPPEPPRPLEPLDAAVARAIAEMRDDAEAASGHRLAAEVDIDLWHAVARDRRGALVASAPVPAYVLATWARSELVFVVADRAAASFHELFGALLLGSSGPEHFLGLWHEATRGEARALIEKHAASGADRRRLLKTYKETRWRAHRRLAALAKRLGGAGRPFFGNDADHYAHLVRLWRTGRVKSLRGDPSGTRAWADIGSVAKRAAIPVRVVHLASWEDRLGYGEGRFRRNLLGLPLDDRSVVLRARSQPDKTLLYVYQDGRDFRARLQDEQTTGLGDLMRDAAVPSSVEAASSLRVIRAEPARAAACLDAVVGMACIPGGRFVRGSDRNRREKPVESVWVDTFYMDVTEVTSAAFEACVTRGACKPAKTGYSDFDRPKQPRVGVSWYDAAAFCRANGKHLPTEAQWEKAARGVDGRTYPWGEETATCERSIIRDATGRGCGVRKKGTKPETGRTWEVGSRAANPYGLHDMSGNAWEWVADWYSSSYAACGDACRGLNPRGPCGGAEPCRGRKYRIVRGGSWYWRADRATTTFRERHFPSNDPYHHYGFRCAASLDEARALAGK